MDQLASSAIPPAAPPPTQVGDALADTVLSSLISPLPFKGRVYSRPCSYDRLHRGRKIIPPPPAPLGLFVRNYIEPAATVRASTILPREPAHPSHKLEALQPAERHANEPTPPLAFLRRTRHTIATSMPQRDQPFDFSAEALYPPKPRRTELFEEFFWGWNAAAHFVHAYSVMERMEDVCQHAGAGGVDLAFRVGNVRAATVLLALAIGSLSRVREHPKPRSNEPDSWIWTLSFGDNMFRAAKELLDRDDSVTLESAQARLIHDMYLLSTNRLMQAWQSFGSTVQMMTSLGLHRRSLDLYPPNRPNYAKTQSERRLFWFAYVLDKQISALFGRPNRWNDEMIDQQLPDCVDYENPDEDGAVGILLSDCNTAGLIHQIS